MISKTQIENFEDEFGVNVAQTGINEIQISSIHRGLINDVTDVLMPNRVTFKFEVDNCAGVEDFILTLDLDDFENLVERRNS